MTQRERRRLRRCVPAVACLALCAACRRPGAPEPPERNAAVEPARALREGVGTDRSTQTCGDRASRFASRGLWRDGLRAGGRDVLLRWTAHYSEKHGECDVLIEHRVTLPDGFEVAYSELWDAFGAAPLAAWTDDPRAAVQRGVCRLEVSDDASVSCRVAKYFIDDHMRH